MLLSRSDVPRLKPVHRQIPFVTSRVVAALMLREMTTTYGRRPGGYLWAVLEPVAGIVLMTLIFSLTLRHPALGTNFAMYYATGMVPFWIYSQVTSRVAQSLRYSRQLLSYPRVTVIDALVARFLLNLMLQLLIAYLVIGAIRWWNETGTMLDLPRIGLGFAMAAALAGGIGALNCVLMTAFPVWQAVWGIVNRPLMLISGVIFQVESIPEPYFSWLLWNPLVHVVSEVRAGFYFGYHPDYVDPSYVFMVSAVSMALGLFLTWRFHREALEAN